MRKTFARGRILPQSLSTDPRYGQLSLKARVLYPLMWANCDDQGRITGNPNELKYVVCPNMDDISKEDVPALLEELETQGFVKVYSTSKHQAIQMLDWWEVQKLQWAWPSEFVPPEGWRDRLRYKKGKNRSSPRTGIQVKGLHLKVATARDFLKIFWSKLRVHLIEKRLLPE